MGLNGLAAQTPGLGRQLYWHPDLAAPGVDDVTPAYCNHGCRGKAALSRQESKEKAKTAAAGESVRRAGRLGLP